MAGAPRLPRSIAARLYAVSFRYYVLIAIALTALLVGGEIASTRAALRQELITYQHAFDGPLASALWSMETSKLEAIATGMVAVPQIAGVRISDPVTGRLFVIAVSGPPDFAVGRGDDLQRRWQDLEETAAVGHAFNLVHTHETGPALLGRAELLAGRDYLIDRIEGQTVLIVIIALVKEAILWGIFLVVSQRLLARPLAQLITALHAVKPEQPRRIAFPAASEPVVHGTELAVVRDTVNELIERLQGQQAQLLAVNKDLETQVAQRTSALEDANRSLRERTRRLAASNAELEQFAYVASHDLRQPLRMVTSYLTLLERRLADRLDGEAREFIGFARDGAQRMDRLIQDLLSLSRIGRSARPFAPTPLSAVLATALSTLRDDLTEAQAEVAAPADLPLVEGDADELVRLMTNLIGNAVKYRSPDRRPAIGLGWRPGEDDMLLFWVEDNGLGIPAEDRERVFQIFQRLHPPGEHEGTGIGLAICKKIVERHGGRIWVESTPEVGSRFYFTLPPASPPVMADLDVH